MVRNSSQLLPSVTMQEAKVIEANVGLTRSKANQAMAELEFQNINLKSRTKLYETRSISVDNTNWRSRYNAWLKPPTTRLRVKPRRPN